MSKISTAQNVLLPREWSKRSLPLGVEFTFHAAKAPGARGGLALGVTIVALCAYWAWLFIKNWFIDGVEILAGGMVLFLVILGGAAFGLYCIRRVFSRTSYLLASDALTVSRRGLIKSNSEKYLKSELAGIHLLFTPPQEAALDGSWRVVLDIKSLSGGENRTLVLEGYGESEAKILSAEFSRWTGLAVRGENTTV